MAILVMLVLIYHRHYTHGSMKTHGFGHFVLSFGLEVVVMAYIVMAYIVMGYIVMAYIVMAQAASRQVRTASR